MVAAADRIERFGSVIPPLDERAIEIQAPSRLNRPSKLAKLEHAALAEKEVPLHSTTLRRT